MKAVVSEKGQVTIPKKCREKLGLVPGTVIDFHTEAGRLVAAKVPPEDSDPVAAVTGVVPSTRSVDDLLEELRGPVS